MDHLYYLFTRLDVWVWPLLAVTLWSLVGSVVRARSARRTGPLSDPVRPGEWWRRPVLVGLAGLALTLDGFTLATETLSHAGTEVPGSLMSHGLSFPLLTGLTCMGLCAVTALWAAGCAWWSQTAAGRVGAALCLVLACGAVCAASGLRVLHELFLLTALPHAVDADVFPHGAASVFWLSGKITLVLPLPLVCWLWGDLRTLSRGPRGVWRGSFVPLVVLLSSGLSTLLTLRALAMMSAWEGLLIVSESVDSAPIISDSAHFFDTNWLGHRWRATYPWLPIRAPADALATSLLVSENPAGRAVLVLACLPDRTPLLSPTWEVMFPTAALDCGLIEVDPAAIAPNMTLQELVDYTVSPQTSPWHRQSWTTCNVLGGSLAAESTTTSIQKLGAHTESPQTSPRSSPRRLP